MASIFCFSSTGNSLYVSKKIAEKLNADVISVSRSYDECQDNVFGFVFPVYFWNLPKSVERFVRNLSIQDKSAYIFAVATYGGVVHGVTGILDSLLRAKGARLSYAGQLKMVENYLPRYSVNDSEAFQSAANARLDALAADISAGKQNAAAKPTVINGLVNALFPGKRGDCDRYFSVSSQCTGCGVCRGICPADNITFVGDKPYFRHKCEHCLACLHACPMRAIDWKKSTAGKERYRHPQITLQELIAFCGAKET